MSEPKKLLIVDDDPSITKLLKTLLTRAHYQVATCGGGNEALRLLSQGHFDLLITDAIMPEMSGFDLTRAIRGNPTLQEIPILMLTRKKERADVQNALEAGVTDYVLKPIDEHLLMDKVQSSMRKRNTPHQLREVAIHGMEGRATARIETRIVSIRESGMVVRFPMAVTSNSPFQLDTPLFKEIGIELPLLKMSSCELNPAKEVLSLMDFPYVATFSFAGITESELRKIRAWLQKQELSRKK